MCNTCVENTKSLEKESDIVKGIQKQSRVGGWELNVKTMNVTWTEEVYRIHKVPLGTTVDKTKGIDFYIEEDRDRINNYVLACLKDGVSYDDTFTIKDMDSNELKVRSTGHAIKDNSGNIVRLRGTFQDITDSYNREQELQNTIEGQIIQNKLLQISAEPKPIKEKLQLSLKTILNLGVLSVKSQGGIFLMKDNVLELIAQKDLAPQLLDLCSKVKIGHCLCGRAAQEKAVIYAGCIDDRHDTTFEGIGPHGHYNVPILNKKNDVLGVMVFYLEHGHNRKEREIKILEMIAKSMSNLIEKEFMKEELEKQKAMAHHNAKLASIGELAAGVAHEINNPLAFVKGYLISLEKKHKEDKDTYKKINIGLDRIVNIVKGLRSFSRVDREEFGIFCVKEALVESVDLIKEIYIKDGVVFNLENYVEDSLYVEGNRGKFQQVLINLISNAKDAIENNEDRRLGVSIYREEESVVIEISDNGCGMSKEVQSKIFDPFFTTKSIGKGTGIGMSMVHSTIKEMDGDISVRSIIDRGTTFKLIFSEKTNPDKEVVQSSEVDETSEEEYSPLDMNILIADDEANIREVMEFLLEPMGVALTIVKDGQEAENALGDNKYDAIISDVNMPNKSGVELLTDLRASGDNTPFVFISGGVHLSFNDEDFTKEVFEVFEKPFNPELIYATLKKIKEGKGS